MTTALGRLLILGGALAAVAVAVIGILPFFGPLERTGADGNVELTVDSAPARLTIYGVDLRATPQCSVTGPGGEDVSMQDAGWQVRRTSGSREYTSHLSFEAAETGRYVVDCLETRIAVGPHVGFAAVLGQAAAAFALPFLIGSALVALGRRREIAGAMRRP